ncbi:Fc.00g036060.m01.CDS01 [Cosmosporella sp. VM-42]
MFYQGTLQDGISTAVGQQKLVLCFVTDETEESTQWETEFLTDSAVSDLIRDQSVALRLKAGSEEAGYLAQIFPLPRTPTVVVIKNGELKEYITPGTTKEDFIRRIQNAFSATSHLPSSTTAQPASSSAAPQTDSPTAATSSQTSAPASSNAQPERSENVRRVLAERAAKLQAEKEEAERKVKEERANRKGKGKAEAEAGISSDAAKKHKAQEEVKRRRQEGQEERRRILKRIEDDKAERKLRAAERERQRIGNLKGGDVAASLVNAPESKMPSSRTTEMTALQVRLFDGSTLRSRFKTASPLKDVRTWVDENRADGPLPYTFKQLLTPHPNKIIDETEEIQNLGELGLSPSSTLILAPVQKYVSAYDGSGNVFSRFIGFILSIFSWFFGLLGLGGGRGAGGPSSSIDQDTPGSQDRNRRVRGFQNPDDRPDQQLYNGNSLNFEPRPDEEEKDE